MNFGLEKKWESVAQMQRFPVILSDAVPGHSDIEEKDKADQVAKEACNMNQDVSCTVPNGKSSAVKNTVKR